jgi:hypothetical protein
MYTFEKAEKVRLNNRNVNVYNVYQTKINEKSQIIETCEVPGVTVVTSRDKFITQNESNNVKVFLGRVYAKTEQEAKEAFFAEE